MKITVNNEIGREVNPWESFYSDKLTFGRCNEYHEAEKNIQSYSAPNIPNTKEGEFVEAELVSQYKDDQINDWRDCNEATFKGLNINRFIETRQIWKLTKTEDTNSIDIIEHLFNVASNTPNCTISIVAKDFRRLKAWLLPEAVEVCNGNDVFKRLVKSFNHTQRVFTFHNGSVIQLACYEHYNDAKCGLRDYLLLDKQVADVIKSQLIIRCRVQHWII